MTRRFTAPALAALLALAPLAGCSKVPQLKAEKKEEIPERFIAVAERRDVDFSLEIAGDVAPDFQLEVKSEVGGRVRAIHVEPGQVVKAGDLLVEVDDRDLQTERASVLTEIEGAKLSVEKLRRNFERARDLFNAKLVSREVFDNLSADYQISQNALERAQRRLAIVDEKLVKTRIHVASPGTVLDVRVIPGQVVIGAASVNSGTPLLTIADLTKLIVRTHVNQYDVAKLSAGQEVRISGESMPGTSIRARVSFIAPIAVPKNNIKGFNVEARVDAADPRLRPGMTVTMTVPVARAADAISIPISAVFRGADDSRVVYARNGAQTETRTVEVGVTNLEFAEIKSGVQPGDRVLLVEPRLTQQRAR